MNKVLDFQALGVRLDYFDMPRLMGLSPANLLRHGYDTGNFQNADFKKCCCFFLDFGY